MQVGVHDYNVPGNLAVATDFNTLCRNDERIAIEIRAVSKPDRCAFSNFQAHARVELAVLREYFSAVVDNLGEFPAAIRGGSLVRLMRQYTIKSAVPTGRLRADG